jgi:hypothetical protein
MQIILSTTSAYMIVQSARTFIGRTPTLCYLFTLAVLTTVWCFLTVYITFLFVVNISGSENLFDMLLTLTKVTAMLLILISDLLLVCQIFLTI